MLVSCVEPAFRAGGSLGVRVEPADVFGVARTRARSAEVVTDVAEPDAPQGGGVERRNGRAFAASGLSGSSCGATLPDELISYREPASPVNGAQVHRVREAAAYPVFGTFGAIWPYAKF